MAAMTTDARIKGESHLLHQYVLLVLLAATHSLVRFSGSAAPP